MGHQSKTYSLSDEVIGVIEMARANGETPNKFLRRVLGIDKNIELAQRSKVTTETRRIRPKDDSKR